MPNDPRMQHILQMMRNIFRIVDQGNILRAIIRVSIALLMLVFYAC